ncbi:MAG: hypothetical protein COC24_018080 [Alphaproteobacteria bacterium]|nr:hypothetical protein [Alphaproteobacteria bacterium]
MTKLTVLYIGPDSSDVAVHRRIDGLEKSGAKVIGFSFGRSGPTADRKNSNIHFLGRVSDGNMGARLRGLWNAVGILKAHATSFEDADVLYCRNLDMALIGLYVCWRTGQKLPLIYEVLDIHPLTARSDLIGGLLRSLERVVLRKARLLIVSSRRFLTDYFQKIQSFYGASYFLENKLPLVNFSNEVDDRQLDGKPLTIGYFGKLRCPESMRILTRVAVENPKSVHVRVGGYAIPAVQSALAELLKLPNTTDLGPYQYPDDISKLYEGVDLNWGLDISGGLNGKLLLPNRIYEGGALGVPMIAQEGTETGDYVVNNELGFLIAPPYEKTIQSLIDGLSDETLKNIKVIIREKDPATFFDLKDHVELINYIRNRVVGIR